MPRLPVRAAVALLAFCLLAPAAHADGLETLQDLAKRHLRPAPLVPTAAARRCRTSACRSIVGPGEGALLHLTFSTRTRARMPARLLHVLRLANPNPDNGAPPRVTEVAARTRVIHRAPAVLGPPLQGSRWVAADGCCLARRHVRAFQPVGRRHLHRPALRDRREQLDDSGRLWVGDDAVLTNWPGYGENHPRRRRRHRWCAPSTGCPTRYPARCRKA